MFITGLDDLSNPMGSDFFYLSLSGDAAQKMRFAEIPERGGSWSNYVVSFTIRIF